MTDSLEIALLELHRARESAADVGYDPWQFAIERDELRSTGLSDSDIRWLLCKGLICQAREKTRDNDEMRVFKPLSNNNLRLKRGTCFVLTQDGATYLRQRSTHELARRHLYQRHVELTGPTWDRGRHELRIHDIIVKRFRWPARNQELILDVFQEEGWPAAGVDDPLPPQQDREPRQRLRDTIRCLNRHHAQPEVKLLVFRGDGTGNRVIWECTSEAIQLLASRGVVMASGESTHCKKDVS